MLLLVCAAGLAGSCGTAPQPPPLPQLEWTGDSAEAKEQLAEALALARAKPEDAETAGRLGMLLHAYDQSDAALQCYKRAQSLDPDDVRWVYYGGVVEAGLGSVAEARESFRRALDLKPRDLAARLRLAEALLAAGETEESRDTFEGVVGDDPQLVAAHYGLGRARAALGETDRAIEAYERAAALSPESGAVSYALALAYRDLGEEEKASGLLVGVQAGDHSIPGWDDPLMAEVRALRRDHHWRLSQGLQFESEGRLEEAREQYDLALQMEPAYAQAHINLIAVYGKLERLEQAEEHYQAALETSPDSEELHINWGVLEASRGRWRGAAESYERALEINPGSAAAHVDLGMILLQQGSGSAAESHFRTALESEPANRLAHFHLGRRLVERGSVTEGISQLEQSLEPVDDRTPTFLYGLADAHLRAGDVRQASARGRQALELAERFGQRELAEAISRGLRAIENAE